MCSAIISRSEFNSKNTSRSFTRTPSEPCSYSGLKRSWSGWNILVNLLSLALWLSCRCGRSAVYRTREMAARALVPFVLVTQVPSTIQTLLEELPREPGPGLQQNHIHGTLLQVCESPLATLSLQQSINLTCYMTYKVCTSVKYLQKPLNVLFYCAILWKKLIPEE